MNIYNDTNEKKNKKDKKASEFIIIGIIQMQLNYYLLISEKYILINKRKKCLHDIIGETLKYSQCFKFLNLKRHLKGEYSMQRF